MATKTHTIALRVSQDMDSRIAAYLASYDVKPSTTNLVIAAMDAFLKAKGF